MAKNISIEKDMVFGLSPKIILQFRRRSGFATFTVHNPENPSDAFLTKEQRLHGAFTFTDPFEDVVEYRDKQIFIGRNADNPNTVIIENELYVDINKDYALFMFLMLNPNNGSNPYRNPSNPVRFWLKPEASAATLPEVQDGIFDTVVGLIMQYRADEKQHSKLQIASNLIAVQDKRYMVSKTDTVEMHKKNLLNYAKTNALAVYKALNDDRGEKLDMVFTAMTNGAVYFDTSKMLWQFVGYNDSYLKVEVKPTEDPREKLVDHLIATPEAFNVLKEMLGY
jgi:hypothetical protein